MSIDKTTLEEIFGTSFRETKDNWKGCCPFHDERTPSFFIHQHDYIANCFGCGIGGDLDNLVAQFLGITKEEARQRIGLTVSERLEGARKRADALLKPVTYFPESWLAPWKKEIHKYVLDRGFNVSTLRGVETLYDAAKQRQVFPHRDGQGKLLGAIGRDCTRDQYQSKWYKYWDYDGGRALYRPFEIDPLRPTLVVEGIFDLLWLHQNGAEVNLVAPIGAIATKYQLSEMREYGESIICGFDNDQSGEAGNRRLRQGLRTKKVFLVDWPPFAKDWMDLSKDQIHEVLDNVRSPLERAYKASRR